MARRKKSKSGWLFVLFLVVLGFVLIKSYAWWMKGRAKFARYPAFGISIPEKYSIHGIDVSKYQQLIAWEEVKAMQVKNVTIDFVFIKATEGIGNTDRHFKRNWKKSKQAGITRGAYHFFLATITERTNSQLNGPY